MRRTSVLNAFLRLLPTPSLTSRHFREIIALHNGYRVINIEVADSRSAVFFFREDKLRINFRSRYLTCFRFDYGFR